MRALALVALAGCVAQAPAPTPAGRFAETRVEYQTLPPRDVDLLFVIDDSAAMTPELALVARDLPLLVDSTVDIRDVDVNLHLGVVSADIENDRGELQNQPRVPGCSPPSGRYLSDIDSPSGRVRNFLGARDDVFACIANLGSGGGAVARPFEAMRRALDNSQAVNQGFCAQGRPPGRRLHRRRQRLRQRIAGGCS